MNTYYSHEQISFIKNLLNENVSFKEITKQFNKKYKTKKSVSAIREANRRNSKEQPKVKVLVFDIETTPLVVYSWGTFKVNIALNQIKEDWSILSWSAKWLGDAPDKIMYASTEKQKDLRDDKKIVKQLKELLDEADVVITQNGKKFDIPKVRARCAIHRIGNFSSIKHFDTCETARKLFNFTSNKLEYLTDKLCVKYKKLNHSKFPGNALWTACLDRNKEAWEEMQQYNKYDVLALEELYYAIRPYDPRINFNLFNDEEINACNVCGSLDLKPIPGKYSYTAVSKFQEYKCHSCNAVGIRGRENLFSKNKRKSLKTNTSIY